MAGRTGLRRRGRHLAAATLVLTATLAAGCDLLSPRDPGERLYRKHCMRCHGVSGGGTVRVISNHYADLLDDDFKHGGGAGDMARVIRDGVFGEMPAYGDKLSPQEVEAIVEHVQTLRKRYGTSF